MCVNDKVRYRNFHIVLIVNPKICQTVADRFGLCTFFSKKSELSTHFHDCFIFKHWLCCQHDLWCNVWCCLRFFSKKVNTQRTRKTSMTHSLRELVRIRRSTVFMVLCTLFSSKKWTHNASSRGSRSVSPYKNTDKNDVHSKKCTVSEHGLYAYYDVMVSKVCKV